ncbi:MAG: FAD-dependent oxidoreductase [Chloroflexi bacterium]|nr:FAD-dependent oxidoreductase [Chloroflexota bacterium]
MEEKIRAAVIGSDVDALQAALYLAQIGADVRFITSCPAFAFFDSNKNDPRLFWSAVLQAIKHPSINFIYNTTSADISGTKGNFRIKTTHQLSYIDSDICTGCKKCEENCSTRLTRLQDDETITRTAIHKPYPGKKSVPSTMVIDKNEISPCRAACPLGINVQGFISLLANNKVREAYELINMTAPLGGILGRLCKHPCEEKCSRVKIDSPVSIRALHRYTYDNMDATVEKAPEADRPASSGKVAIVGSGPAGLMAAWELKRRGYEPTVFESHGTFGGMLATGIPRFRLSREIREREINKLISMGIKIRTGITVGRDIDFAYLRERDYKAFFLAIGASRNIKLNIPGEDLAGVIDCMSFLITLNQMGETFVGSNIVIIGDGNTAVDSARVAIRKNKGSVKIISWTVPEELTAAGDEIEEAFEEGVSIEYSAFPVEILGEGNKVVGVRCRRTRLTDEVMRNGWHKPEPVPGTDFVIDADHVIVAIGQSSDATQLNLEGLAVEKTSGTIKVNPLTLETNLNGVFAGGDCMRGPNNVVDAMADGMRAAESIDRYLAGSDMEMGRQEEPAKIAEVDVNAIVASPSKRAQMPYLDLENRKNTYEETTSGFSAEAALEEAKRCLSCALCSECMECVKVCKANAIVHADNLQSKEIEADIILRFPDGKICGEACDQKSGNFAGMEGIYDFSFETSVSAGDNKKKIMAGVIQTILDSTADFPDMLALKDSHQLSHHHQHITHDNQVDAESGSGIFLCRCNGENSSVIDFERLITAGNSKGNITHVSVVEQACTESGASIISEQIKETGLKHVIIAACRCCNYDQVCYSCNDRRILLHKYLSGNISGNQNSNIDYINIRELCAWAHNNDRVAATDKALRMLEAAVAHLTSTQPQNLARYPINPVALFIGGSNTNKISAMTLEVLGYVVFHIEPHNDLMDSSTEAKEAHSLAAGKSVYKGFPDSIKIDGCPGNYQVRLEYANNTEVLNAGAIILDSSLKKEVLDKINSTYLGRLCNRIISGIDSGSQDSESNLNFSKYEATLNKVGLFINTSATGIDEQQRSAPGVISAAKVLMYFRSHWITMRHSTAQINTDLCRACRNCVEQCPLIEIQENADGRLHSYLEQFLCTGCGACSAVCPTSAIYIDSQNNKILTASLKSYLCQAKI